ncbi:hypothetical protein AMTR_s00039p00068300 [Amborella trichopoda]|uniref:Uncharacterized protein n=1 Tax=Amborella trichopoda TaxID=13333 RepID=U5CZZ1_AMBTC|nr:hypothetical protein AMTR_s00039p00068300 [Amborella trichopoda]
MGFSTDFQEASEGRLVACNDKKGEEVQEGEKEYKEWEVTESMPAVACREKWPREPDSKDRPSEKIVYIESEDWAIVLVDSKEVS